MVAATEQSTALMAETVRVSVRKASTVPMLLLVGVALYLIYAWNAFDITALLERAQLSKGALLISDSVAYKTHVTKNLRRGDFEVAIEGERHATYKDLPDWVRGDADKFSVDLGDGYVVRVEDKSLAFEVPGYGTIRSELVGKKIVTELPEGPVPDWLKARDVKLDARPTFSRRVQMSRAKIEIHKFDYGWENFWFPFTSVLHGKSFGELLEIAGSPERLDADMPNWRFILSSFWGNPEWQHGIVAVALFETILMAVLGTVTAAACGLPLAFVAASNFNPNGTLRFVVRRIFDFVRGIDMLIWSLIFIRAFGLGPLTGSLAIAFTDTGSLGKLFSEALENIDRKQVEGVESTGANRWQRYRFGVIPQILPVFTSQFLYYVESNTRSATVIGALGAGGIGLVLVETMRTQRDWENTFYIIGLIIVMVFIMDSSSSWLRRKLIAGGEKR
ncbi:phosphonate ABC transporter, permease protein PhnE [Nisaea acidiphila]|uniref:Phosphonate ABC transporter, permease protein PhnE n=1 Tax=Nisaea acidiphila TaxID=1862145 RepID=A0A9J7ANX0_9PROT|nr:phosphonate ABC transporter, permease protein PhnE [Nisaea acidiphila]UUX48862.1 phosphonate ABC transporter, permease protein PhnE [Nisaea acidiphila]